MYSHIDSVGSVMFVEISSRHKETQEKKHLGHRKVDWLCQDFTQGSTKEQPT